MSQDKKQITFFKSFLIGGTASCIATTIEAPFINAKYWVKLPVYELSKSYSEVLVSVIKNHARLRLALDSYNYSTGKRQFTGLGNCITTIYKNEGLSAFYRGFGLSATSTLVYSAAFFGGYDSAKGLLLSDPKNANLLQSWAIAQVVTTVAGVASHPFDMVMTRLHRDSSNNDKLYSGVVDCYKKIIKSEGAYTLFRGAFTNSIRNSGAALALVFYDQIKRVLRYGHSQTTLQEEIFYKCEQAKEFYLFIQQDNKLIIEALDIKQTTLIRLGGYSVSSLYIILVLVNKYNSKE
ncbi:ADP/ATP translocase [Heterostelium album PN500]|uniref:ADP/ATP translocase n=1 Tax=Heterostelium pallidum (strain ATCC 26659 / Pp 5 / PN500) TaxID=670386 RepID=D3B4S4_HETP5|nr:ADP/ATP translocase [Heterostelium album PN500]EFA84322.1 ADP/ATP translocase [Heterostelium album PN500]|eukprot:XP_020436437.1 ADP/ATP translocase [Heterostelium album PN500]